MLQPLADTETVPAHPCVIRLAFHFALCIMYLYAYAWVEAGGPAWNLWHCRAMEQGT